MKSLLLGIAFIVLVGIAGFLYRNAVSRPTPLSGACTADAMVCPDGSAVGRVAPSCNFAPCPAPNVTITSAGIIFALPAGYSPTTVDGDALAAYAHDNPDISATASSSAPDELVIRSYAIPSGETGADVMHATAVGDASGLPVSPTAFSAAHLGNTTYSYVVLGRFEGVVHVAYYLLRANDVLRFEAIDQNVSNWTDAHLDINSLPASSALRALLTTMQTTN